MQTRDYTRGPPVQSKVTAPALTLGTTEGNIYRFQGPEPDPFGAISQPDTPSCLAAWELPPLSPPGRPGACLPRLLVFLAGLVGNTESGSKESH